jgi:putative FmdB family regulatory protein
MPIYQYKCPKCNLQFEVKQSFKDEPIAICPVCHSVSNRIFSPVPILFKGPGFYITDSRAEKERHTDAAASGKKGKGKDEVKQT